MSHESIVLSYSECKIAKMFYGFAPGPHWEWLTVPKTPQLHIVFSPCYAHRKIGNPKKLLDTTLLTCPRLRILGKTQTGISNFQISGQSFINKNCHNSRTSHDIDMKHQPVIKLDKRNTTTSKKIDNDIILRNCDLIVFFPIYGQFAAIGKPDLERMV